MNRRFRIASLSMLLAALAVASVFFISSCSHRAEGPVAAEQSVVIGVPANAENFNPVFTTDIMAAEVNELVYPMLVGSEFDTLSGVLAYTPLLAVRWESGNGGKDITFHLKTDAKWADGTPVRARDVQYSFGLYADPEVGSYWFDATEGLKKERNGRLDVRKAIEIRNDSTVTFHFKRAYSSQLFDAGVPIIPAHVFSKIPRKDLKTHAVNRRPIGAGPFSLSELTTSQEVVLIPNHISNLVPTARLDRLIFRAIPDYRTRLLQLRSGEIDIMSAVDWADLKAIAKDVPEINVIALPPRRLHYIGWNNIEPIEWTKQGLKGIRPHHIFGSANVRRALTMAINRKDIAATLLGPFGSVAVGPVSPIFSWAQVPGLQPPAYDPKAAQALLAREGWTDTDNDGVLDKDGRPFAFVLRYSAGLTIFADIAAIIQQQLRAVKVDVIIQQTERSVFWTDLFNKKYDAWIAGYEVPLEIRLDDMWNSALDSYPMNIMSYQNPKVDRLLKNIRDVAEQRSAAQDLKEIQRIIAADQPCTFLFWERGRIAANRRVRGLRGSVISMTNASWEWSVAPIR